MSTMSPTTTPTQDSSRISLADVNIAKTTTKRKYSDGTVILDTGATISVFHNRSLLHDIITPGNTISLGGFSKAATTLITKQGSFGEFGKVWINEDLRVNLISMSEQRDLGARISYDAIRDQFIIKPANSSTSYAFSRRMNCSLYTLEFPPHIEWPKSNTSHTAYFQDLILFTTVAQNQSRFTIRQREGARKARVLMSKMGLTTSSDAKRMVTSMIDCDVSIRDIDIADEIYGWKSATAMMGNTKHKRSITPDATFGRRLVQQKQTVGVDLMFIAPLVFIIAVAKPLDYTFCHALISPSGSLSNIDKKSITTVKPALLKILSELHSRGFESPMMTCDGEGAIAALVPVLNNMGIEISLTASGQHVHEVERKIQFIKEKHRIITNSLPYIMCAKIKTYCVYFNVFCINNFISRHTLDGISARERFTGIKPNMKRDYKFEFRAYCQATVPNTSNDMTPRTSSCICLLSTNNATGSVLLLDINTLGIIRRDHFSTLPMPNSIIAHLNDLALKDGIKRVTRYGKSAPVQTDPHSSDSMPDMIRPIEPMRADDLIQRQEADPNLTRIGGVADQNDQNVLNEISNTNDPEIRGEQDADQEIRGEPNLEAQSSVINEPNNEQQIDQDTRIEPPRALGYDQLQTAANTLRRSFHAHRPEQDPPPYVEPQYEEPAPFRETSTPATNAWATSKDNNGHVQTEENSHVCKSESP